MEGNSCNWKWDTTFGIPTLSLQLPTIFIPLAKLCVLFIGPSGLLGLNKAVICSNNTRLALFGSIIITPPLEASNLPFFSQHTFKTSNMFL